MVGGGHQRNLEWGKGKGDEDERFFSDEDDYYEEPKKLVKKSDLLMKKPKTPLEDNKNHQQNNKTPGIAAAAVGASSSQNSVPGKPSLLAGKKVNSSHLTKEIALTGISKAYMSEKDKANFGKSLHRIVSLHLQKKGLLKIHPEAFQSFYSLAHLYLYDNKIEKIQGLNVLPQLESLHLSENNIKRIEGLEHCVNLRQLFLGSNHIEVLEGLDNLNMLLELHIEDQKLPAEQPLLFCPNSLDTVSRKLKVLNLSGNQLENLEDLMCMDVLDTLNLSRNKLCDVDHASAITRTMRQLRVLDLRENPLTKDPKYKEKIIGFCNGIEVLDNKDVNEVQRRCLQRLCSIKISRSRHEANKRPSININNPQTNSQPYKVLQNSHPAPSSMPNLHLRQGTQRNPSDHFTFSTPTSVSPTPEQQMQNQITAEAVALASCPALLIDPQDSEDSNSEDRDDSEEGKKIIKEIYAPRSHVKIDPVDEESEKMSEMAKIIFRLSNLTASTESINPNSSQTNKSSAHYWSQRMTNVPSTFKESRPLSPLELDVTGCGGGNQSRNNLSSMPRRSAPIRRTMPKKLPPRHSFGAGRTLSPLEELPTPDSAAREGISQQHQWIGTAFQTSSYNLPPWPHITRKQGMSYSAPTSKVRFSQ